ncbi:MAG: CbiX/SirB N-terminal domain-containing protein, partial [Firmicutes bacterium]|nr:CbiX/SirB N-terminal domain-containing protein [Bacillota bacterium]
MKSAVLLVGHGSRRAEANDALFRLEALVSRKRPGSILAHAFLQLAQPDVHTAIAQLDEEGVEEITIVPVFLYEGVHIKEDFPEILAIEVAKRPHLRLVLAPVMGIDERMAEIIWDRVVISAADAASLATIYIPGGRELYERF